MAIRLTDIASAWTECVAVRLRNQMLVIEGLEKAAAVCHSRCLEGTQIAPGLSDTSAVRIVGALLAVIVVFQFRISWHGLAAFSFCVSLIALGVMDFRARALPDLLTLPLLAAGIGIRATCTGFTDISDSAIGVVTAYLLLSLVNRTMRHRAGVDPIGHGDLTLLAAIAA